jgi:hypothetical protein
MVRASLDPAEASQATNSRGFFPEQTFPEQAEVDYEMKPQITRFGMLLNTDDKEEENLYKYIHQRANLKVTQGDIPVGFLAQVDIPDEEPIFLETRDGGFNDQDAPIGPQYRVSWKAEREVIAAGPHTDNGWSANFDELWKDVLAFLEHKGLEETSLEQLDADPFVLFGIDDEATQQSLQKLDSFPALYCERTTPNFGEWAAYLRIEPGTERLKWLVQSFSETDLPKPWTCYKGVGSIVCYIQSDSGAVTWKHPFYDYFRQLRDFCEQASDEEVMQVRCNRLLWSYEASRVETANDQAVLVSPEYIAKMCDIFDFNVKEQGYLVRNIKAQLKVFARSYRTNQAIDLEDVIETKKLLDRDVIKFQDMKTHWQSKVKEKVQLDLNGLANGEIPCVNCNEPALSFCLECKDYLCASCYKTLHSKGARMQHSPFQLVPCMLCVSMPAKLHCTFTDKSLCHKCYAMKHIKMLPTNGKENQPRRIDYVQQYKEYERQARDRANHAGGGGSLTQQGNTTNDAVLSADWHSFYDLRGVKYWYNFKTAERMRQSPRRVPNEADAGAMEFGTSPAGKGALSLQGFDALDTGLASHSAAAQQPEVRALRPPHRMHMPNEVPLS